MKLIFWTLLLFVSVGALCVAEDEKVKIFSYNWNNYLGKKLKLEMNSKFYNIKEQKWDGYRNIIYKNSVKKVTKVSDNVLLNINTAGEIIYKGFENNAPEKMSFVVQYELSMNEYGKLLSIDKVTGENISIASDGINAMVLHFTIPFPSDKEIRRHVTWSYPASYKVGSLNYIGMNWRVNNEDTNKAVFIYNFIQELKGKNLHLNSSKLENHLVSSVFHQKTCLLEYDKVLKIVKKTTGTGYSKLGNYEIVSNFSAKMIEDK
jgi:hypothetical protein